MIKGVPEIGKKEDASANNVRNNMGEYLIGSIPHTSHQDKFQMRSKCTKQNHGRKPLGLTL